MPEVKTDKIIKVKREDSDRINKLTSGEFDENIALFRKPEDSLFPIEPSVIRFNGVYIITSTGTPEGVIFAPLGSFYLNQSGGANTSMYVKETEVIKNDKIGWVAK